MSNLQFLVVMHVLATEAFSCYRSMIDQKTMWLYNLLSFPHTSSCEVIASFCSLILSKQSGAGNREARLYSKNLRVRVKTNNIVGPHQGD